MVASAAVNVVLIVGTNSLADAGLATYHHRWLLVDPSGQWQAGRWADKLSTIEIRVAHGHMTLRAPGMLRIDIPMDVIEDDDSVVSTIEVVGKTVRVVDEGDLAATWFGNVVGEPCRLLKVHPDENLPAMA